jgi:hypothetical protein
MRPERRSLSFDNYLQVVAHVRELAPAHHTTADWSLAQICHHLTASFIGSMEGFDLSNHRLKRLLLKRKMLQVALSKGIPRNYMVDPNLTPPPEVDLQEAIHALANAIQRYENHRGVLHAHPLFGKMSREVWDKVHCVHCAHHLSFVIP